MSFNEKIRKSFKKKLKNKRNTQHLTSSHTDLSERSSNDDSGHSSLSSNIEYDNGAASLTSTSSSDSHYSLKQRSDTSSSNSDDICPDQQNEDSNSSSLDNKKTRPKSIIQKFKYVFSTKDKHKSVDLSHSSLNSSSIPEQLNIINEGSESSPADDNLVSSTEDCDDLVGTSSSSPTLDNINTDLQIESDAETIRNEDQTCSTDDEYMTKEIIDSNENKVEIIKEVSDDDIWLFISDPAKHDISLIGRTLSSLKNVDICDLYREFGHDKTIIHFIVVESVLSGNHCIETEQVLQRYRTLNERRLQDSKFYESLSKISPQILSMKSRLDTIVKVRTINSLKCLKCKKEDVSLLYLPCGHIILCSKCNDVINHSCECCGSKIQEFHQVFL